MSICLMTYNLWSPVRRTRMACPKLPLPITLMRVNSELSGTSMMA